jgi:hypothetical protein
LLKRVLERNFPAAAEQFGRWTKGRVNGRLVSLPGLVRRRAAERKLFEEPAAPPEPVYERPEPTDEPDVEFGGKPPVLALGDQGRWVQYLQVLLNAGQSGAKLYVDGDFGPKTQAAVRAFQLRWRLVADGIVGPITWARLQRG